VCLHTPRTDVSVDGEQADAHDAVVKRRSVQKLRVVVLPRDRSLAPETVEMPASSPARGYIAIGEDVFRYDLARGTAKQVIFRLG
jgi:hypothetical protein